ncbi:MAG: HPF/RaiA family ribosome-associated protein [Thioalkalispiraceae bacterium]|jgi:ribosomal subunit interface protein
MQIEIQTRDFALAEALGAYIEQRINFALSSRYDQIKRIQVRLLDINGPRGGIDKRCQIHITLPRLRDIVIEDTEQDLYVAIDRATDRAARTVHRRLARQFFKRRKIFIPNKRTLALE